MGPRFSGKVREKRQPRESKGERRNQDFCDSSNGPDMYPYILIAFHPVPDIRSRSALSSPKGLMFSRGFTPLLPAHTIASYQLQ